MRAKERARERERARVRAPDGEVPYNKDWDGVGRAAGKVEALLRLLHRVLAMVDTSRWVMMKWPVAAVGFLTTAMGAMPDDGHKCVRRLRTIMIKHMGDLWAAQVARRREADDSEVMEGLKQQWNDVRKFTPRMPTWAAVSQTQVFRIRNLLLKWHSKAAVMGARQPKITQWLSTTYSGPGQRPRSGEPADHAANAG